VDKYFLEDNDFNILYSKDFTFSANFKNNKNLDFLKYMSLIDYKNFLKDDVLVKVDRATMSISLEGREPLLDHRIIEYIARIPVDMKYKNGQNKYLLRKILYKYIPSSIIDKPKSGFQIPLSKWLRGKLKDKVNDHLNSLDKDIFEKSKIDIAKKEFFKGNDRFSSLIWFLFVYSMWEKRWI